MADRDAPPDHPLPTSAPDGLPTGAVTAAVAAALFPAAAAPGLTWLDAGELGAAAWELGIAHPPGFPVFALVHKAVMLLLPLGEIGFRGNLASGLLAAAAVGFVAASAVRLGVRPAAASGGALLMGMSGLFLLHASTIEVYSGAALWVAVVTWLVSGPDDPRRWLLVALLCGLAAGHHAELRLFVLVLVPWGLAALRPVARRAFPATFAAGLLGATTILYLPLRSAGDPWRDWGDPESAAALWDHLTGARIRSAFAERFGTLDPDAFLTLGETWFATGPVLLVLGIVGMVCLARQRGGGWVFGVWAIDTAFAVGLNPMGLSDLQNGVPGLVALGLAAASALERLPRPALWAGVALIASVPFTRDFVWPADRGAEALVTAVLREAPPEPVIFVGSDTFAAGLAFAQVVEGARPDAAVVVRQHVWDASSLEPVRNRLPWALEGWRPGAGLPDLAIVRELSRQPVRWEWTREDPAPAEMGPAWPILAPHVPDGPAFLRRHDALAGRLGIGGARPTNPQAARMLGHLLDGLGVTRLEAGDAEGAGRAFARAAAIHPDGAHHWTNLGAARAEVGDTRGAIEATRAALERDPDGRTPRLNLARYLLGLNADDRAALLIAPLVAGGDADALGIHGVIEARAGRLVSARAAFEAALRIDPDQLEARVGMARLTGQ